MAGEILENKLIVEIKQLQEQFEKTTNKFIKDVQRQEKIMERSDKRQKQEYDELQHRLQEVTELQIAQKNLLDAFIKLIASAIDAKSKYTGGHCERVPELCMMIAEAAHSSTEGNFANFEFKNDDERRELNIAGWLHDCGKVVTPEYVVDKATKLETIYNRIHEIRTRFEVIHRDLTIEALNKKLNGENSKDVDLWLENEHQKLKIEFETVANANVGAEFMKDETIEEIKKIASRTWIRNFDDTIGLAHEEKKRVLSENSTTPQIEKLLSDKPRHIIPREDFDHEKYENLGFKTKVPEVLYNLGELYNITVKAGTLSYEERFKIQEHIHMTIEMLEQLPFPEYLKNVPIFAGAHHETLDGTGYPRQIDSSNLPLGAKIMALADVFEALTASDRPYKEAKTLSKSIDILHSFVQKKHLDEDVFILFLESGIYLDYAKRFLKSEQIDYVDILKYINKI